ncbi:MAG: TrkH family potassium uptake protein [Treponemataceae bacterium]
MKNLKFLFVSKPPFILFVVYVLIVVIFAGILMLPISTTGGSVTNFTDAFFTSASAFCVTGLTVETTADYWSTFGQIMLLLEIQLGGLGIMTIASFIAMLTNQKLEGSQRKLVQEATNSLNMGDLADLVKFILKSSFIIESVGALLLAFSFVPQFGIYKGIWFAVFHSISAYCNAGFDLLGNTSLCEYASNVLLLLTISALIVMGGIGFRVYDNVLKTRQFKKLRLHSKIVLASTVGLLLGGAFLFLIVEWNNPKTIGGLSLDKKILTSFFQSVTTRTAGFASVDQLAITDASAFLMIILMFIGGSPAGTAGGIKTTTFITLLALIFSMLKNKDKIVIFKRRIPDELVKKAFAVFFISLLWCLIVSFLLMVFQKNIPPLDLIFETFSAFATVGLTRGVTPSLCIVSKFLISLTMLFGKVGVLGIAFAFAQKKRKVNYREAEEKIVIG